MHSANRIYELSHSVVETGNAGEWIYEREEQNGA